MNLLNIFFANGDAKFFPSVLSSCATGATVSVVAALLHSRIVFSLLKS
jgi:hypothetical protein